MTTPARPASGTAAEGSPIGDRPSPGLHRRAGDTDPTRHDRAASILFLGVPAWGLLCIAILVAGAAFDLSAIVMGVIAIPLIMVLPIVPLSVETRLRTVLSAAPTRRFLEVATRAQRTTPVWLGPGLVVVATGITLAAAGSTGSPARVLVVGMVIVAMITLGARVPLVLGWSAGALLMAIAAHTLIVAHTPSDNDVWFVIRGGVEALERGANPYTSCWPATPDPITECAFPYLPATAYATLPFHALLGDVRYGLLAAMLVGSVAIGSVSPRRIAVALSLLPLPLVLVMVDRSWNEPLLIAALAVMVVAVERRAGALAVIALALALATKQHAALLLPLAAWWPAFGPRRTVLAVAGAAALSLPLVVADPGAFVDDTVRFLAALAARPDSVSLHALLLVFGIDLPTVVAFAAVAIMIVAILRFGSRTTLGFVAGSAAVLATLNLLGKQSFFNYHAFVLALLAMAFGLAARALVETLRLSERSLEPQSDAAVVSRSMSPPR